MARSARRTLQFGHLKTGFHFVPEGHPIVARRFIAGLAVHRDLRPRGTLEVGSRPLRIRGAEQVQTGNCHTPPITLCYLCVLLCKFSWTTSVAHAPNSGVPPGRRPQGSRNPAINRRATIICPSGTRSGRRLRPQALTVGGVKKLDK
jgi:hypothetical protein